MKDIRGTVSVPSIAEFLAIWEMLRDCTLSNVPDSLTWRSVVDGIYFAISAYASFVFGRNFAPCVQSFLFSWAPLEAKIFCLTLRDRLWTADRLIVGSCITPPVVCFVAKVLDHPRLQCSFAREVCFKILLPYRPHRFTPSVDVSLHLWCAVVNAMVVVGWRREIDSRVVPILHSIWLEHNIRIFDKAAMLPYLLIVWIKVGFELWKLARLRTI